MLWARVQYSQVEKGQMTLESYLDLIEFRLAQYFRESPPPQGIFQRPSH